MNDRHILYHVTPGRNVEYIQKFGLIPAHQRGFLDPEEQADVVWLTTRPVELIEGTEDGWFEENQPVILTVDVGHIKDSVKANIRWDEGTPRVIENNFFVSSWISPSAIKSYDKYER